MAYLIFGGGGNDKQAESASSAVAVANPSTLQSVTTPRTPGSASNTISSTPTSGATIPATPTSEGTVPSSGSSSSSAPRSPQTSRPPQSPRPVRPAPPISDPAKLRRIDTSPRPSVYAPDRVTGAQPMRTRSPNSGIKWKDDEDIGQPLTETHSDDMMFGDQTRHFNYVNHEDLIDYKGKVQTPEWKKKFSMARSYKDMTVRSLLQGRLDPVLEDFLQTVENIARYDARIYGSMSDESLLKRVRPLTLSALREQKQRPELVLQPLEDDWDPAWGALPRIATMAAERIADVLSAEDVRQIRKCMDTRYQTARRVQAKRDKNRSWSQFVTRARAERIQSNTIDARTLCIGWFADHFRSTSSKKRMNHNDDEEADNGLVNMTKVLGAKVANLLRWLEALGDWMRRYRLFTPSGVDLCGNGTRLAINGELRDDMVYRFERTLTIFMWSEGEDMSTWFWRMREAEDSFSTAHGSLVNDVNALEDVTANNTKIRTECIQTRLVFRPGLTVKQTTDALSGTQGRVDTSVALAAQLDRHPKSYRYDEPSKVWYELQTYWQTPVQQGGPNFDALSSTLYKLISFFGPNNVTLMNMRQNQWAPTGVNHQQGLNKRHLLVILYILGPMMNSRPSLDYEKDLKTVATMSFLDLTCFIPLAKRTGDPSKYDFFPIRDFAGLSAITIPFTSHEAEPRAAAGDPSTIQLITSQHRGLLPSFTKRTIRVAGEQFETKLNLYVTVHDHRQLDQLRAETAQFLVAYAREQQSRTPGNASTPAAIRLGAMQNTKRWAVEIFQQVATVNAKTEAAHMRIGGMIRGDPLINQLDVDAILASI